MENSSKALSAMTSLFTGVVIGLGIGLLTAPKSGEESRDEITAKLLESKDKLKESAATKKQEIMERVSSKENSSKLESLRSNIAKLSQDLDDMIEKAKTQ